MCLACTLPTLQWSLAQLSLYPSTFLEIGFLSFTSTIVHKKEGIVLVSFFQNPANQSMIMTTIAVSQEQRYEGWGGGPEHIRF